MAKGKRTRCNSPALRTRRQRTEVLLGLLRAVGSAPTLALARVFAVAAIVAGFAAAFALARVLALTSVLFFVLLVALLILALVLRTEGSLQRRKQSRSLDRCCGSGEQSCERRPCEHGFCGLLHSQTLPSI